MVGTPVGTDRDPGTPDLLGDAATTAACGRSCAGRGGLRAAAIEAGRTAAADASRGRGGRGDAIAILINRTNQKVVRLRQGGSHSGWSLTSVQPREAFRQGDYIEVLALQRPDGMSAPAAPPATAAAPADGGGKLTMPTAANNSFASFMPRAAPKNGEAEGL